MPETRSDQDERGGVGPTSPPTPQDPAGLTSPGTHGPTVWIIAWIITRADI